MTAGKAVRSAIQDCSFTSMTLSVLAVKNAFTHTVVNIFISYN